MEKIRIHSIESFGTVDGPGIRFVTFLQGCPLRCPYCHNPDTWDPQGKGQYEMTPEELRNEAMRYYNFIRCGGVTVTGGEPLMQAALVAEYFRLCHAEGLHTALDTSGCIHTTEALGVLDHTDLVLLDIKTLTPPTEGIGDTTFLDILQERGIKTWIRHVVVPGRNDSNEWLNRLGEHVGRYDVVEKIEIQPYHTIGVFKYKELGIPYPLEGVPVLPPERAMEIKKMLRKYRDTI